MSPHRLGGAPIPPSGRAPSRIRDRGRPDDGWIEVAPLESLPVDRGVAALVAGTPVAVFRLTGDEVAAIDHVEPFTGVPVLARGLVGSAGDVPTVASPLHKQRFDLRTGRCLDDPEIAVRVHPVRVVDGVVEVAASPGEFSLPKRR